MALPSAKFVLILSHCAARWACWPQASVAIDGSKFKAVNNRDKNFTRAKMERRMAQIEEGVARYLEQLDTADRQEPSEAMQTKTNRLKEKIETLKQQMRRLERLKVEMLATPDQQISLTDPDARSMATSGRGSGIVGYNVQIAVEANHHLIVMHEVTNDGTDRSQLSHVANETKAALGVEKLDAVADRGYFNSEEIRACEEAGITVTLPKPMTSNAKAEGRFGKQDFRYVADEDIYVCPAGEKLAYHYTTEENGLVLRRYWTNVCQSCAIKPTCTTGKERRITRWEHEHILEAVQRRLDEHPEKMRQRRETVEHPFGTIKARMGATHFLMKTLPTGRQRDGATRTRLQSHPRHEHHRHPATHHSDQGIVSIRKINAPRQLRRPCVASPWAFLHNQDPFRSSA